MDVKSLVGGKSHFTDIPESERKFVNTERNWAKQGYVAVDAEAGTWLYSNYFHNGRYRYLHADEVRPGKEKEIAAILEKKSSSGSHFAKAYQDQAKIYMENIMDLEQEIRETRLMLREARNSFLYICTTICNSHQDLSIPISDSIVIDTETTGMDAELDEILQISILDANTGSILFSSYVKPMYHVSWPEAQAVNGIDPSMVADAPYITDVLPVINHIVKNAKLIIGYNTAFDLDFLRQIGIDTSSTSTYDIMDAFARVYGEWNEKYESYTWQKLTVCADYYGYDWDGRNAHDSLSDCFATLHCYKCLIAEKDI